MMALFRRSEDSEGEPVEPMDDAVDFVLTRRQALLRRKKETRKTMEHEANVIWGGLAAYASTLSYVP